MQDWLLYCLDEQGRVTATETLGPMSKTELRNAAKARLAAAHGVEVWDGAICILRLHREAGSGPSGEPDVSGSG